MANFNVTAPTGVGHDPARQLMSFQDSITVNNSVWNSITWYVPASIKLGILEIIAVEAFGAATVHDLDADGEYGMLAIARQAQQNIYARVPSRRCHYTGRSAAKTQLTFWGQAEVGHIQVMAGDYLELQVPPPDDHGTPTGDYYCFITIRRLQG